LAARYRLLHFKALRSRISSGIRAAAAENTPL
jgi:hypothetical protein